MTVAIRIMAHPKRVAHVEGLASRLRQQGSEPAVLVDENGEGPWSTCRRAWLSGIESGADHVLVMQDDVRICRDLVASLPAVIAARSDDVVTLFFPRRAMTAAKQRGISWVRIKRYLWAQATMMPARLAAEMVAWADANDRPEWRRDDDVRMGAFFAHQKRHVWATVPSLVQHADNEPELRSLLKHFAGQRQSPVFVGEDGSGVGHPWHDLRFVSDGTKPC